MFKVAPLSSNFMLLGMFGFIFSAMLLKYESTFTYAVTGLFFFSILFIASMISMTNAPINSFDDEIHIKELAIHEKMNNKAKKNNNKVKINKN